MKVFHVSMTVGLGVLLSLPLLADGFGLRTALGWIKSKFGIDLAPLIVVTLDVLIAENVMTRFGAAPREPSPHIRG